MGDILKVSIDYLNSLLLQDSKDSSYLGYQGGRFPTRIIYTDDFNTYVKIIKVISDTLNPIVIPLSEYCSNNDALPNLNQLINDLSEGLKENKLLLVSSLGEVIRLNKKEPRDYNPLTILRKIHSIETPPQTMGRLFIVLFGVSSFVNEYWRRYSYDIRKFPPIYVKSSQKYTPIKLELALNYDIIELTENISRSKIRIFNGFKEYLRYYEDISILTSNRMIVVYSRILNRYLKEGSFPGLEIEILKNIKDIATKILGFYIPFTYKDSEITLWKELISKMKINMISDVIEYLKKEFNIQEFSCRQILGNWKDYSEFEKWLAFNWMKLEQERLDKDNYLKILLQNNNISYRTFENVLWLYPFELPTLTLKQMAERRKLLEYIGSIPPKEFFELLSQISDPIRKLILIPGITFTEKVEIIRAIGEALKMNADLEILMKIIKITYPDLYSYINFIPCSKESKSEEFICNYFKQYIISRLMNKPTEKLLEMGTSFHTKGIHITYKHRNSIMSEFRDYPVIWIDALGVEWIGLVKKYLETYIPDAKIKIIIGKASIPTITEFNKPPVDTIILEDIKELDQVLHSRRYPQNIVDEIETLKKIISQILPRLISKNIIITSDHGATQFNGHIEERIQPPFKGETKRDGRYMVIDQVLSESGETEDYSVEIREGKTYLVSKTYKVFPGGRVLYTETHGGATPEELLVPVIIIEPTKKIEALENITIFPITRELKLINPILQIRVETPLVINKLEIKINNRVVEGVKKTEKIWIFNLKELRLKPGEYTGIVLSDDYGELGEVKFKIKGGMEVEFDL